MPYKYSKNYSLLNILSLSQLESQIEPTFSFSDSLIQPYNDLCHRVFLQEGVKSEKQGFQQEKSRGRLSVLSGPPKEQRLVPIPASDL